MFQDHYASSPIPIAHLPSYQRQDFGGRLITDLAFYQAQYDREVRYLDREIGRLLETAGWADSAELLIVLTADHGESMGEHDYYLEHGRLPYQPTAHVPLIVVQPAVIPGGRTIEHPVGLLDMSATIVELAGLPVPSTFEGTSLSSQLRGDTAAPLPEYVFMQSGTIANAPQLTVRQGRWKLIRVAFKPERRFMTGAEYELYDLDQDPGETLNLAAGQPEVVDHLKHELERWYADRPQNPNVGEALDIEHLDPGSRKMLEALGYLEQADER
jgi:arylsulfatase A-like enzyme